LPRGSAISLAGPLIAKEEAKRKQRSLKLSLALGEAIIIDAWRRDLRAEGRIGERHGIVIELPPA